MKLSKKHFGLILCIVGIILFVLGIYQILCPSFKTKNEIYTDAMRVYENCNLGMSASSFWDIRQGYRETASQMYELATEMKQEINVFVVRCVILCVIGTVTTICGTVLTVKNKDQTNAEPSNDSFSQQHIALSQ